jgi:hypothetical protein
MQLGRDFIRSLTQITKDRGALPGGSCLQPGGGPHFGL